MGSVFAKDLKDEEAKKEIFGKHVEANEQVEPLLEEKEVDEERRVEEEEDVKEAEAKREERLPRRSTRIRKTVEHFSFKNEASVNKRKDLKTLKRLKIEKYPKVKRCSKLMDSPSNWSLEEVLFRMDKTDGKKWEVRRIRSHRLLHGALFYEIQWKGRGYRPSFEPCENLSCFELLDEYHKKIGYDPRVQEGATMLS